MPNQRAKHKVFVGVFVDFQLKRQMLTAAKSRNLPLSELVTRAVVEYCERMLRQPDMPLAVSRPTDTREAEETQENKPAGLVTALEDVWLL